MTHVAMIDVRAVASRIVAGLDAARRRSNQECPVDEHALIEAGVADAVAELEMQIALRDDEIRMLKQAYEPGKRRAVSPDEATAIVAAVNSGMSMRKAAKQFGLKSPSTVHRIVRGQT